MARMGQARCTKRHSGVRLAALPSSERWHAETRAQVWASLSSQERAALGALRVSDRERDVVACAIVEQSQKETAETLGLSLHTIKRHGRAIAFKTRFENVGALARHVRASCREAAQPTARRTRRARAAGTRTLNACHTSSGGMFETRRNDEAEDGGEAGEAAPDQANNTRMSRP